MLQNYLLNTCISVASVCVYVYVCGMYIKAVTLCGRGKGCVCEFICVCMCGPIGSGNCCSGI